MILYEVAHALVAKPKGLLAGDESINTMNDRLEKAGTEGSEENRRIYRTMLATTDGIGEYISGIILNPETLRQSTDDGILILEEFKARNIIPGVKVDLGLEKQENGETLVKGLEGLPDRLQEYVPFGVQFAKWRAVFIITDESPTPDNIKENARRFGRYAKDCQNAGIVPIVEPEVKMDGAHTIEQCAKVTAQILTAVFKELREHGVDMRGMVLKPNMIIPGEDAEKVPPDVVAHKTVIVLSGCLPDELPGVAFLSGGIGDEDATRYLNAMNKNHETPWNLTFSWGRGLLRDALAAFAEGNLQQGQALLLARAKAASEATEGRYSIRG